MAVNVNCPVVGSFTANGTALMEVAYMESVTLDTEDRAFSVPNADPFSYFALAEEASGATMGYTVSISDKSGLKSALGGWLDTDAKDASGSSVSEWMLEYLRGVINALVNADGVGAALEAHVVKALAFTDFNTPAHAGADALIDSLDASGSALNSIGLQLPASRYPETFAATLPTQSGDSLTFQFTITSSITVTDSKQDLAPSQTNVAGAPSIGTKLNVTNSRIVHIIAEQS